MKLSGSGRLTAWVVWALLSGIAAGALLREALPGPPAIAALAEYLAIVTDLFLRLIKMVIAPLVFATLVGGIARMGSSTSVGRIGLRAVGWFFAASVVSLGLGLLMVNLLRPGEGLDLAVPAGAAAAAPASSISLKGFVTHLVPRSIAEAMAQNEVLQIVVFSVFAGLAAGSLGERAKPVVALIDALAEIMLKITGYVMQLAPLAVLAAVTSAVATQGLGILATYGRFMGGFFLALALLWAVLFGVCFAILGSRARGLASAIRVPVLLAFSTASSESAYPRTLEQLEKFGASNRVASFILPLGYSFNLDGSMMYCAFATLFIAQAYNISLSIADQITMLLVLMVTSKGIASVPRASLTVVAATLTTLHLPESGLLLLLAVDQFLDMGRTATNVVGNSVATVVIAKWEGQLRPREAAAISDRAA